MDRRPLELGTSRLHADADQEEAMNQTPTESPAKQPAEVNLNPEQVEQLRQQIVDVLHTVFDPEIPVNVYELGLIYKVDVQPNGNVHMDMTLTTPACPVAGSLPGEIKHKVKKVANVTDVRVDLVWDPPWDKNRMSEAAKLQLGIDD